MTTLLAAVDEIATETQLSEGWTYCVLPRTAFAAIQADIDTCTVKHFHGRRFNTEDQAAYRKLLIATRRQLEAVDRFLLSFTLLNLSWKVEFITFLDRVIAGSMDLAGIADKDCVGIAQRLFPGLATLQRLTASFPSPQVMDVDLASDTFTERINGLDGTLNGCSVAAARILAAAYRGHRSNRFPASPELGPGGIRVISDTKSLPVQVADVFGNFALACLFRALGNTSRKRDLKATIFADAFGDAIGTPNLAALASLKGKDIELKENGALTLQIGSHI